MEENPESIGDLTEFGNLPMDFPGKRREEKENGNYETDTSIERK